MAAPTLSDPAAMATTSVGSTLRIHYNNGSTQEVALAYRAFFNTGAMVADGKGTKLLASGYLDINGRPMVDKSVPGRERPFFWTAPTARRC